MPKDCYSQSFWTQMPQRAQRNIKVVLQVFTLEATMGLSDQVEIEHNHNQPSKDFT